MAKILLIDDDEHVLKVMTSFLEREHHEIETAVDGRQGIKLLENQLYDLIITDIIMPEEDGLGVLMWLMNKKNCTKVIVMSGGSAFLDQNFLLNMCKRLHADKVLSKPVEFETLREAICEVMAS